MLNRRTVLAYGCGGAAGTVLSVMLPTPLHASAGNKTELTPDQALALLKHGNREFAVDHPSDAPHDMRRRVEIAPAQTPFAVIVACADSRVPPELLFERGLGDLFVVRDAGNIVDIAGLGSIQYAVVELGTPLVLVLGHQNCGAVRAAIEVVENNATFPGSIGQMLEPLIRLSCKRAVNQAISSKTPFARCSPHRHPAATILGADPAGAATIREAEDRRRALRTGNRRGRLFHGELT